MAASQVPMEVGAAMAVGRDPMVVGLTVMVGSIRTHNAKSPAISGRAQLSSLLVARGQRLPRLINTERADTVGAQLRISDRPASLSHPVGAKATICG